MGGDEPTGRAEAGRASAGSAPPPAAGSGVGGSVLLASFRPAQTRILGFLSLAPDVRGAVRVS